MKRILVVCVVCVLGCGDNHIPGGDVELEVSPQTGLRTTEGQDSATFTVALRNAPSEPITIALASLDTSEGTVSPATITLDADNFSIPVSVTVAGVDDDLDDGDQTFEITVEAAGAEAAVEVTNVDNDGVGISVTPIDGLMTTEAGGTATFSVVLDAEPTADVVIALASDAIAEGTVEPATFTFTPANWNAPQIATVTGVDDDVADGSVTYAIEVAPAASTDPAYSGMDPSDVEVSNIDNDSPGIIVTPTSDLVTAENSLEPSIVSVVLTSQPTADVTIAVSSSDPTEGRPGPTMLTFTVADWDVPHPLGAFGEDDALDDGDQSYTLVLAPAVSADLGYNGIDPDDVSVTNLDDENPGVIVTPSSGLTTNEDGLVASFTVRLLSPPIADVVIPVVSSDPTEGTPDVAMLTFTPGNFDQLQTVRVTGQNDALVDGNQPYRIELQAATSADPAYDGFDATDVNLTNNDNDTPGILVTPTSGLLVSELGDTATFTIVLLSEPAAPVSIALASSDTTEGTVAPASVTFDATNWDMPQTIVVTGKNDAIADGNIAFAIVTAAATSVDPAYNGLNAANVAVTNFDDDTAAIIVTSDGILEVTESGATATFTMVLTQQPTANVTCAIASSDTGEATVSQATVVFTPANFATDHVVTVTGVDDAIVDGPQLLTIVTAPCSSTDPAYNNVNPRNVNVRTLDND
ncbi:MAG: hypothetical protein ABI867_38405 [Kofleriaceae bacterium]